MNDVTDINTLTDKVKRKYLLFSTGFVVFGLSTAVAISFYNTALGVATLLAELTYFSYVNMVNVGEMRERLKAATLYTKKLNEITVDAEKPKTTIDGSGQYL